MNAVAWSLDGKLLASGSADKTIQIWDAFTGHGSITYQNHTSQVHTVAWSPEGILQHQHTSPIYALSWSPNGRTIASGGDDHIVQVWRLL